MPLIENEDGADADAEGDATAAVFPLPDSPHTTPAPASTPATPTATGTTHLRGDRTGAGPNPESSDMPGSIPAAGPRQQQPRPNRDQTVAPPCHCSRGSGGPNRSPPRRAADLAVEVSELPRGVRAARTRQPPARSSRGLTHAVSTLTARKGETMTDQQDTEPETGQARGGDGKFIRDLATAERDAEAAQLRSTGMPYRKIAAQLGINVHTAHDAVKRAMAEVVQEDGAEALAFELRRLDEELERLDDLYGKVMAVLEREHVTVSQGRVVTMDDGATVPDDDWILKAVDRLVRIDESRRRNGESRRRLLGLDQPVKTQISGGLTYEVVGVDPEALT